jgi:hypothetical protein
MRWSNNIRASTRCCLTLSCTHRFQKSRSSGCQLALSSSLTFLHLSSTTTSKLPNFSNSLRQALRPRGTCVSCGSKLRLEVISFWMRTKKSTSTSCSIWWMKIRRWSMRGTRSGCQGRVSQFCMNWDRFWRHCWGWAIRWWCMIWIRRRRRLWRSCLWTQLLHARRSSGRQPWTECIGWCSSASATTSKRWQATLQPNPSQNKPQG